MTGRSISEADHLTQSIADILTTPKGSRVMRRDYGSRLPDLIDAPINGETVIDVIAETADALDLWEPRLRLRRVEITTARAGTMSLVLTGEVDRSTASITVEVAA